MKRKVTDLKPNEAILISNDSERDAILQLMEDAGMRWMNGAKLTELNPAFSYPFALETDNRYAIVFNEQLWDLPSHTIIPASDFIGSEGDFDIPSNDSTIATFLRWQIDWYESNHDYQIATDTLRCWLDELEGKTEPIEQPRNTQNNERTRTGI
jgi:hypothetical protein